MLPLLIGLTACLGAFRLTQINKVRQAAAAAFKRNATLRQCDHRDVGRCGRQHPTGRRRRREDSVERARSRSRRMSASSCSSKERGAIHAIPKRAFADKAVSRRAAADGACDDQAMSSGDAVAKQTQFSDFDGGSIDGARASRLRQSLREDSAHRCARRARRGVRFVLLQQPAVRPLAVLLSVGQAGLGHRRLRQCRGVSVAGAHLRALSARSPAIRRCSAARCISAEPISCTASRSGSRPTSIRRISAGRRTGSDSRSGRVGITPWIR